MSTRINNFNNCPLYYLLSLYDIVFCSDKLKGDTVQAHNLMFQLMFQSDWQAEHMFTFTLSALEGSNISKPQKNSSSSRRVFDSEQQGNQVEREKTATCMHVHIVGGHVCHLVAGTEARRVYKVQLSCVGSR